MAATRYVSRPFRRLIGRCDCRTWQLLDPSTFGYIQLHQMLIPAIRTCIATVLRQGVQLPCAACRLAGGSKRCPARRLANGMLPLRHVAW